MSINKSGVTKPLGYVAAGVACNLKKNGNKDLAMIISEVPAVAAGVFTKNVVKGHALTLSMEHIKSNIAKCIVINSGNANACNGARGIEDASLMAHYTSEAIGCKPTEVLLGSTGVVGIPIDIEKIKNGIHTAQQNLSPYGGNDAAQAIMTTDTISKEYSIEFNLHGNIVTIGAMAKGSGMIHPNMATMISVITTDIAIAKEYLDKALQIAVEKSYNRISVDGDTSVCDMVVFLANGMAGNKIIFNEASEDFLLFTEKLTELCIKMAKMIAADGEGATKLIEINVINARTKEDANKAINAIAKSPLVKTAFFGEDANWGRLITALGYSGAEFNPEKVDIIIGDLYFCKNGESIGFDEEKAKDILKEKEIIVTIDLQEGNNSDRIWTCDFSYDYIKINGSYRT